MPLKAAPAGKPSAKPPSARTPAKPVTPVSTKGAKVQTKTAVPKTAETKTVKSPTPKPAETKPVSTAPAPVAAPEPKPVIVELREPQQTVEPPPPGEPEPSATAAKSREAPVAEKPPAAEAGPAQTAPSVPVGPQRPPIPPRPPAKPEVFVEGDHVVYPTHGVGKVERIAFEEIAGQKLELIHITFEENRMTLRVPVAKARTAGLRKLATRKLFDEALAVLKGRARVKRTMWSRRAQEYEAKINSGDPLAIAEVVRDLHRNAGQPDQSFSERQIYEAAMDRLAAELAALDKTDKTTAAVKLTDFLKTL
jgi:CarD family transcriptional regulator